MRLLAGGREQREARVRQHAEAARSSGGTHPGSSRRGCTSKTRSSITSAARDGRNALLCGRGPFQSIFFACGVRVVRHIGFEFMISEGFGWVASGAGRRSRHHSVTEVGARSPRISHATMLCFPEAMWTALYTPLTHLVLKAAKSECLSESWLIIICSLFQIGLVTELNYSYLICRELIVIDEDILEIVVAS